MDFNLNTIENIKPEGFYNVIYDESFHMQPHRHVSLEFMYVVKGSMNLFIQGKNEEYKEYMLTANQFVVLNSQIMHGIRIPNGLNANILNVEFTYKTPVENDIMTYIANFTSFRNFPQISAQLKKLDTFAIFNDTAEILTILQRMHKILTHKEKETSDDLLISFLTVELFTELTNLNNLLSLPNKGNIYIKQAIRYISTKYNKNITSSDVAKNIGISVSYLNKILKEEFGNTAIGMIHKYRINRACQLLVSTNMSIKDIMLSVGYKNKQCFWNNFRELVGKTPNLFRKEQNSKHYLNYAIYANDYDEYFIY